MFDESTIEKISERTRANGHANYAVIYAFDDDEPDIHCWAPSLIEAADVAEAVADAFPIGKTGRKKGKGRTRVAVVDTLKVSEVDLNAVERDNPVNQAEGAQSISVQVLNLIASSGVKVHGPTSRDMEDASDGSDRFRYITLTNGRAAQRVDIVHRELRDDDGRVIQESLEGIPASDRAPARDDVVCVVYKRRDNIFVTSGDHSYELASDTDVVGSLANMGIKEGEWMFGKDREAGYAIWKPTPDGLSENGRFAHALAVQMAGQTLIRSNEIQTEFEVSNVELDSPHRLVVETDAEGGSSEVKIEHDVVERKVVAREQYYGGDISSAMKDLAKEHRHRRFQVVFDGSSDDRRANPIMYSVELDADGDAKPGASWVELDSAALGISEDTKGDVIDGARELTDGLAASAALSKVDDYTIEFQVQRGGVITEGIAESRTRTHTQCRWERDNKTQKMGLVERCGQPTALAMKREGMGR